jgi:ketosteroid isomerase-like protein
VSTPAARLRNVSCVPTAVEVADHVYERWNAGGLSVLTEESVDPEIELICDPLRPQESALHGHDGWRQWVGRWERSYESMHVTIDGLVPIDADNVLALVSIEATPIGGSHPLHWAAAHVWTVREGRISRWETHLDLGAARRTLD